MFRKEKGVTLVALIITIIVLLILAGVAFSTLLGNNGLLNRAAGAGNTWQNAVNKESEGLINTELKVNEIYNQYKL